MFVSQIKVACSSSEKDYSLRAMIAKLPVVHIELFIDF